MLRPPGGPVDDAEPTKHLLGVPVEQAVQVGVQVEADEGILLLARRIVVWPAVDHLDRHHVYRRARAGWVQHDAESRQHNHREGNCREESKEILEPGGGSVHCFLLFFSSFSCFSFFFSSFSFPLLGGKLLGPPFFYPRWEVVGPPFFYPRWEAEGCCWAVERVVCGNEDRWCANPTSLAWILHAAHLAYHLPYIQNPSQPTPLTSTTTNCAIERRHLCILCVAQRLPSSIGRQAGKQGRRTASSSSSSFKDLSR